MDKMVICGGERLRGEVRVSGAKNAALPVLVSSILADGWNTYRCVPDLVDVRTVKKLLSELGATVEGTNPLRIHTGNLSQFQASYDLVKTMRASVLVLGPLVARLGRARVSLPGGCAIGARPVNLHLKALKEMGADIDLREGYIEARADRLRGARIYFDISTVTGTENVLMAAVLAEGTTILENAAREPEVVNLAEVLIGMGANIEGAGTGTIVVEGVKSLRPASGTIIPDRIEAGTFAIAAAMTGGDVRVLDCIPVHLDALTAKLAEAGSVIEKLENGIRVRGPERVASADVMTLPYPGFATDLQAQFMALMTRGTGTSVIRETVFENRFMHVQELVRLGADIRIDGNSAIVRGVERLTGAPVMATDLRASACLVVAALAAEGTTELSRIYHLDRGYDSLEKKLSGLGANIRRVRG
ncbi:MAG TPA: UDP-N-acetylglucosamine 1-carboxyvinyltransferase [Syntrophales bacterium]|nr:UDP-N-acetylglucosamine 1-carboxyvinyltransferase [Syntrophales bacterium]HQN78394.1 UDP-N-acetylglucosamine 1-carboxyvinyltransferase [Syntrophales bacterium]HQQ27232.1 UDP-N-acetylglucosamine 1-carboxyvinyltransferase [Syntrophales bacterium]